MAKKSPSRPARSRAKVVNNTKQTRFTSLLRSKWAAFGLILVFASVGAFSWVRTSAASYSLWSNSAVPKTITDPDTKSVELGVKFKSKHAGYVDGVRFYKGPQNTGTHTGSLWTKDGQELARVTFKNETAGGWQTAYFEDPVPVAANTVYVVSYHAPKGRYSANNDYFKSKDYKNGPLTAPKGKNGVYKYGNRVAFPNDTFRSSNYWVDPVFSTSRFFPSPKPQAPTELKAAVNQGAVSLAWKASLTSQVAQYRIFRDGAAIATVNSPVTDYTDTQVSAEKTYSYQVQAIDGSNVASDFSNTAKVTIPKEATPDPDPDPGTPPDPDPTPSPNPDVPSTSNCPYPAYPNENCTGYKYTGVKLHPCKSPLVAGETYDSCEFNGEVTVADPNIVVTRSKINGIVNYRYQDGGSLRGLKLIDVEIDSSSYLGGASIGNNDYTCNRCHVHGGTRGANVGFNVYIVDSYLHGWTSKPEDHITGIGSNGGANNVIDHNSISCDLLNNPTHYECSAGLSIYGDDAPGNNNWVVTRNLINSGSSYCLTIGGVPAKKYPITNSTVTDNKFGNFGARARGLPDAKCTEYGPANVVGFGATNVWRNNVDWNGNPVNQ